MAAPPSATPSSANSPALLFPAVDGLWWSTLVFSSPQMLYVGPVLQAAGGWFQKLDDAAGPGEVLVGAVCW